MTKKLNIHYYSDCYFFAGCENMLVNFFSSSKLADMANVSFTYRQSKAYEEGLNNRYQGEIKKHPIRLLDINNSLSAIGPKIVRVAARLLAFVLLLRYWAILINSMRLYRHFNSLGDIDILHINNGGYPAAPSFYSAVLAAKWVGIPKIVYVANNLAQSYNWQRWLDYPLDRLMVKHIDQFITGSQYAGTQLIKVLQLPEEKWSNIHNGILLRPITQTKEDFLKAYDLPLDRPIMGIVALLEERKGHIYLLKALKQLVDQSPTLNPLLLIEGTGPEKPHLLSFIEENNLAQYVAFIDRADNIMNFIAALDVLILSSIDNEDFPNVVIEGMGLGKAVIASRLCGTPEQIDNEKDGILVEPKNYQELANKMVHLLQNTAYKEGLENAAKTKFERCFSAPVSVDKYINLYQGLIGKK